MTFTDCNEEFDLGSDNLDMMTNCNFNADHLEDKKILVIVSKRTEL